jgi:hypothetical protein
VVLFQTHAYADATPVEPAPEQVMQVQEVEQQANMEGEQVGLDYLAQTMDGIDAAEDVEEMINAIRGNNMPIEARRMELADFVGRDDAMATPETVLAMVQPTIMMSEEGAMSSGIGDLMRQMTEDVDMSTEGGAPTDMGEGARRLNDGCVTDDTRTGARLCPRRCCKKV